MPVGAFGGRADVMEHISPTGPVYQAGTLSGNPIAVAAGIATLKLVAEPGFYDRLSTTAERLTRGLEELGRAKGIPISTNQFGGMFGVSSPKSQKCEVSNTLWAAMSSASTNIFTQCWSAVSIWHRQRSKRLSFPAPMERTRSTLP